jgi:hypothetical protein
MASRPEWLGWSEEEIKEMTKEILGRQYIGPCNNYKDLGFN